MFFSKNVLLRKKNKIYKFVFVFVLFCFYVFVFAFHHNLITLDYYRKYVNHQPSHHESRQ